MASNAKLPDGVTLKSLQELYEEALQEHTAAFEKAAILDGTDKGKMWDVIGATFPAYQILPNTNHVAYIKNNLVANIYTVGRAAKLIATTKEDKDITMLLNIAIEHAWSTGMIGYHQMLAGERAALINKGISKVSWDNSKTGGKGDNFYKGETVIKNIDPLKFLRDPFVDDIDDADYAFTWDDMHQNVVKRDTDYKDEFKKYMGDKKKVPTDDTPVPSTEWETDRESSTAKGNDNYVKVIESYVFDEEGKLWEIHSVGFKHVLLVKERKPAVLPFSELFCNITSNDIFGTSEPARIYSNSVAINLMNSFGLTAEYKNQRPPKYVSGNSGLDVASFRKHGNDADHTFVVNGDSSRAVHYHEFPQLSPQALTLVQSLGYDIQHITGIDGRYTGRDTGSIMTTGGMDDMLNQVSLIDQPKIINYEKYSKRLTQLVLKNLLEFGQKRKYFYKGEQDTGYKSVEVDFPDIDSETLFAYDLNVSAILPKSQERIAQMANVLMEKQMQYASTGQQQVDLITPEEWLRFQDLPNKEYMLERMGIQRSQDYIDQVSQTVFTYAGLTEKGMEPSEAMVATADILKNNGQPGQAGQGQGPQQPETQDLGDMGAMPNGFPTQG
jgi:hypothetical protein